jgi:hypothetical protein
MSLSIACGVRSGRRRACIGQVPEYMAQGLKPLKILAAAQAGDLVAVHNRDVEIVLCGQLDTRARVCRRVHKVMGGPGVQ